MAKAPVNEYSRNRVPVNIDNQVIIRSNVVTEEATFSLAPSQEYQIDPVIDENHYVPGVVYPGRPSPCAAAT